MADRLKKEKLCDILCMIPIILFVLSILIVRLHLFSMPMTNIYWSEATNDSTLSDLFNYWKAITIIGVACLAVLVFIIAYFKDSIRFKKSFLYIPVLVYVLFVLISYAFSDYKYFALRGMSEHFEGTFVLLSYMIMVIFLASVVDSEKRLKTVVYSAICVALLLGILGITQATGHDFFSTAVGQKLMTPNYMLDTGVKSWDMIDILAASGQKAYDFSFTEGEVYQTVYNINYVPLYLSLLVPLAAACFLSFTNSSKKYRSLAVISLVIYGLFLYNYFTANSASGYFGLFTIFFAAIIVTHTYFKKWIKQLLCLLLVLGLIMGLTTERWLPEIKSTFNIGINIFTEKVFGDSGEIPSPEQFENLPGRTIPYIDYIESEDNRLDFSMNGNVLRVTRDTEKGAYELSDIEGNPLYITSTDIDEGWYQILDDRFHDYALVTIGNSGENSYFAVKTRWDVWQFRYNGEKFVYLNQVGKEASLRKVPHSHLIKDYNFATMRGLIWDTTIPLLKDYIIKGAGADCFTFVYPQNDYATKYNLHGILVLNEVTDKAHNLYMQYWVNTGLISLLAWLTMVGYYLVGAAKQFRKRGFVDFCDFVNGGIFCGICGFLAVALFNDGSVNTMPMFYTMLGTGLAINMRDKWPGDEPVGETSGSDGADPGEGKKKGKKAKTAAEVMPEM